MERDRVAKRKKKKEKKRKMIDRFHGGHDGARDTEYLSDDPRHHRSFIRSRDIDKARRDSHKRIVIKFSLTGIIRYSRDAQILTAGKRVIVIRDVSSAQDLSNESVRRLGNKFHDLGASLSIYLSISVSLHVSFTDTLSKDHGNCLESSMTP